ncbi:ribonuclease 3-like protein 2 [Euphorbia lathyris]|uniref:ribonuclease 3-like protein 2 n=1 Tax=Euphorbia lathyris TaxID=212925 RepID=UPI0033133C90
MEASVFSAVETLLDYKFKNKSLLQEALTHPSFEGSASYQRLEFIGDAALGLALGNHFFLAYPHLDPGQLTRLRAANISNEKLARVAVIHDLYRFLRHNVESLDDMVREFTRSVRQENKAVAHGGAVKAPKIIADLVESLAGAIYVDLNFNLEMLWVVFRPLLEPIVTLKDLQNHPQPVTLLYELCQKKGKEVDIVNWPTDSMNIASVYVDGAFVVSGCSEKKETAKLNAAEEALAKLSHMNSDVIDEPVCIENAKHELDYLCDKKKWPKPSYSVKELGPPHEKKFICIVQITTTEGVVYKVGEEKTKIKAAKNSAASVIIRALRLSHCL